jgi:hypothetical protein
MDLQTVQPNTVNSGNNFETLQKCVLPLICLMEAKYITYCRKSLFLISYKRQINFYICRIFFLHFVSLCVSMSHNLEILCYRHNTFIFLQSHDLNVLHSFRDYVVI